MKRLLIFSLRSMFIALMLFTASCSRDKAIVELDNAWQKQEGTKPSFVDKGWQMTAITPEFAIDFDGDGKIDSDLMPFLRTRNLNPIRFESNGRFGDAGDNRDFTMFGTWTYNEATKKIFIADEHDPTSGSEWTVIEASAKTLKVRTKITEDGKTYEAVVTWNAV